MSGEEELAVELREGGSRPPVAERGTQFFELLCLNDGRTLEESNEKSTSHQSGKVGHDTYVCKIHDRIASRNDIRRTLKNAHDTAAQDHAGYENAWSDDLV